MLLPTTLVGSHSQPERLIDQEPRDAAFGKIKAMVEGTRIVRAELAPQ